MGCECLFALAAEVNESWSCLEGNNKSFMLYKLLSMSHFLSVKNFNLIFQFLPRMRE